MVLSIYADGSSNGRSDNGTGWAYLVVLGGEVIFFDYGGTILGTNNTAELTAAIEGLKRVLQYPSLVAAVEKLNGTIELVSDSRYVLDLANGSSNPHKNQALAAELKTLTDTVGAKTRWVKGHSGDKFNDRVDKMAKLGRKVVEAQNETSRKENLAACG